MDTKLIIPFGEKWKKLSNLPTIEHHLFFQYLLVSPSYYQASLIRKSSKDVLSKKDLPKDMNQVLKIYDLVGDIYLMPFEVWWESVGCELFYAGTQASTLTFNLDLSNSKQRLLEYVEMRLDEALAKRDKSKAPKLSLLTNKVRTFSLYQNLNILFEKAMSFEDESEKLANWQIALISNLETKWRKGLKLDSRLTRKNLVARQYLCMLVSKNISEALIVAENAARGIFPSKQPVKSSLKFDFARLSQTHNDNEIAELMFIDECLFGDSPMKFQTFSNIMITQHQAKRKARKKLDDLVAKEIEKRAKESAIIANSY